jgi:hypothetical protein
LRLRLNLAVVSLTLAGGTTVGAGRAALFSCQVGQRKGEVAAVLALNVPAIRSVGEAIWPRLLLDEALI